MLVIMAIRQRIGAGLVVAGLLVAGFDLEQIRKFINLARDGLGMPAHVDIVQQ